MYAKIFGQIYDGTLCTNGPWQALVTFQQLLILADEEGNVDMTIPAIARRTTIPREILEIGIEALLMPDPESRTPTEGGRRIVPLGERSWGWRIVNYMKYRQIKREQDRRDYHKQYYHDKRKLSREVKQEATGIDTANVENQRVKRELNTFQHDSTIPPIAYTEAEAEAEAKAEAEASKTPLPPSRGKPQRKRSGQDDPEKFTLPEWIDREAWTGYEEMRVKLKKPLTDRARMLAVRDLQKLRSGGHDVAAVLDQSTQNGWLGLFEVKSKNTGGSLAKKHNVFGSCEGVDYGEGIRPL
jgi:hypothetical protein